MKFGAVILTMVFAAAGCGSDEQAEQRPPAEIIRPSVVADFQTMAVLYDSLNDEAAMPNTNALAAHFVANRELLCQYSNLNVAERAHIFLGAEQVAGVRVGPDRTSDDWRKALFLVYQETDYQNAWDDNTRQLWFESMDRAHAWLDSLGMNCNGR